MISKMEIFEKALENEKISNQSILTFVKNANDAGDLLFTFLTMVCKWTEEANASQIDFENKLKRQSFCFVSFIKNWRNVFVAE